MGLIGAIFFAAVIVFSAVAWARRAARDREKLADWEAREQELADAPDVFHWDDHVEDPDAWKNGDSEP